MRIKIRSAALGGIAALALLAPATVASAAVSTPAHHATPAHHHHRRGCKVRAIARRIGEFSYGTEIRHSCYHASDRAIAICRYKVESGSPGSGYHYWEQVNEHTPWVHRRDKPDNSRCRRYISIDGYPWTWENTAVVCVGYQLGNAHGHITRVYPKSRKAARKHCWTGQRR